MCSACVDLVCELGQEEWHGLNCFLQRKTVAWCNFVFISRVMPGILRLIMSTLGWQGLCRCTLGSRKEQKAEQPHSVLHFWARSPCVGQLLQSPFVPRSKVSGATVPQCSEENSLSHLPYQKHLTFQGEEKSKHHKAFTLFDQTTFKSPFQPKPFYGFMILFSGRKQGSYFLLTCLILMEVLWVKP